MLMLTIVAMSAPTASAAQIRVLSAGAVEPGLLATDSLVYNRASIGLHAETVLERLQITAQVAAKTTRYADGASVMAHVVKGHGREIGLGATTEILSLREQGLQFVGPLPPELQNFTRNVAMLAIAPPHAAPAWALLAHFGRAASKPGFVAAGVAAAP